MTGQINRFREESAVKLNSFNKSLALQSNFQAYIQHLIARKDSLSTAQQLIDSVLRQDPKNDYYLVLKGQLYDARMQYDSALIEYDLAMQRDSFPFALEERARTFIKLGKYEQATGDYRSAFNRNYDYSYSLALLFDSLKRKDSAIKYYLIFTEHYPNPAIKKRIELLQNTKMPTKSQPQSSP